MLGRTGRSLLCVGLMFGLTAVVQAQPYTTTVDFNDDLEFPEGEEFIWQSPAWSGSTQGIVCTRGTGGACIERDPFDNPIELSQRVSWSGLPSPAVEIFWVWDDPANTSGVDGVRATTAFSDNMSRPSMHLGGKLRFKIAVSAWNYNPVDHSFDTQFKSNNPPQAGDPSILLALGVKETGNAVPQGDTDNGSGDIEFVYLPGSILPTTTNGLMGEWPPMGLRIYAENDDWPPDADDYQQVEFDFGPGGGLTILGFANDGTAPDTAGDGVLDATTNGDGVNRGPMEALFFTNDAADTQGQFMFVYIDDVEFVSNVIDPVPTPTVEAPIYVDAVEVVVSDLIPTVDRVELWKNSALLDSIDTNGVTEWTFTIAAAQLGDTYTAKQRDSDDGRTSDESQGVTVIALPFPGPPINAPPVAGTSGVEVIGIDSTATEVEVYVSTNGGASYASLGTAPVSGGQTSLTFTAPAPLIMGDMLQATMRVEGDESDPSGPVTVTTNGLVVEYANDFEGYADQAAFEADGWVTGAGDTPLELNTNGNATLGGNQSLYAPMSVLSTDAFRSQRTLDPRVSGTDTHPLVFTFNYYDTVGAGTILRHYCELRDYVSDQTGLNQIVAVGTTSNFPSGSETIDINYYMGRIVFSSAGYFNLDGPTASQRSIGWHTITSVVLSDTVDFYLDGILADRGMVRNGSFGDFNNLYLGSGATSYNGAAWFDDVSLTTGRVTFPEMAPTTPIAPTVRSPILEDETTVTVTGVAEDATGVDVFADGNPTPIGHVGLIPPNSGTQVDVTVPALTVFQSITATQTNVVGESPVSLALEVGRGHGPIMLGVGIRETGDTGALGSEGSGAGSIEWINVTTNGSEEIGISVTPQNSWQTITFDSANGVTGFTGNGQIDGVRGTLEHLAIWVDGNSPDRSSGTYRMYVDNVINVDADGGGDYLITDFESFATGDEVLFQEPTFSGSSSAHLSYPPSVSGTSAEFASTGSQSQLISWFFRDSTVGRWVRDTTSGATNIPRPVIDITKPIKMDILLMEGCPTVSGDMDGDCDIDLTDYDAFEACLGGLDAPVGLGCVCADFDGDNRVDLGDFAEFQADFTNGVAVPGCTP